MIISSDIAAEQWNAFVGQWPDFALMQSYEWGQFKETLGWKAVRLALERNGHLVAGAQVLIKPLALGLTSVVYVPRGPLLHWEDKATVQALLSAIHALAQRHRAIVLKIEPAIDHSPEMQRQLESYGFQRSDFNNQPQCTMLIELTPDADTLLANMHKTTRYNIRYSTRQGVTVHEATLADLDTFYHTLELTANQAGFPPRSREYYRQEWNTLSPPGYIKLFLAMYKGEVLATRMSAAFGRHAATLHSGSFRTHKKLKPNELLMWQSLKWAKAQGCTTYDVWGIPDEIGAHLYLGHPLPEEQKGGLWGVYRFKRGFGGKVTYYVGAYDFVYSPLLYWSMNAVTARLGSLDKLAQLGDRLSHRIKRPIDV
ncbi:MAG: peptidoglycan bridge formation glycyltransferase FemA/FemB family protein [Chloroflexi bacterium]|nr:peptidoglycan bridge formation glycyltransferase FemA/FemB family protein [Chloroflexota bacterium]